MCHLPLASWWRFSASFARSILPAPRDAGYVWWFHRRAIQIFCCLGQGCPQSATSPQALGAEGGEGTTARGCLGLACFFSRKPTQLPWLRPPTTRGRTLAGIASRARRKFLKGGTLARATTPPPPHDSQRTHSLFCFLFLQVLGPTRTRAVPLAGGRQLGRRRGRPPHRRGPVTILLCAQRLVRGCRWAVARNTPVGGPH